MPLFRPPLSILAGLAILSLTNSVLSEVSVAAEFPLWSEGAPGALGNSVFDIPTLSPYFPDSAQATGAAVIICPGGGYANLSHHEGEDYARFLTEHGVASFVLKYRVASHGYHHPAMIQDATRALRFVRANAEKYHIDAKRIGIMGSSAGGHLASTLLTHFDAGVGNSTDPIERVSSRPDFGILCYPVITLTENTRAGSKQNLLGPNPDSNTVALLSSEKQVTKDTPPCFIWHTWEDQSVSVRHSLIFAEALQSHGIPFDLHVYRVGAHGMGLGRSAVNSTRMHPWTDDLLYWLRSQGLAK